MTQRSRICLRRLGHQTKSPCKARPSDGGRPGHYGGLGPLVTPALRSSNASAVTDVQRKDIVESRSCCRQVPRARRCSGDALVPMGTLGTHWAASVPAAPSSPGAQSLEAVCTVADQLERASDAVQLWRAVSGERIDIGCSCSMVLALIRA